MGTVESAAGRSTTSPYRQDLGRDELGLLRGQLTNLRALLVLSILMTESADDQQILRLATSAASSLGTWQIAGFVIGDAWWAGSRRCGALVSESGGPELAAELRALPETGGPVGSLGAVWAWAYPLRSIAGRIGYLVVHAAHEPAVEEQFLAQVLAQQTGVAVSNAQLHRRERDTAEQLAATNEAQEETVATLRRGMVIHERLTRVAAAGEGAAGIAEALHDLTGLAVAVEDRYGNLSAWAGPGQPARYPKPPAYEREQLLRRLMTAGRSVRDGGRVVALASPRPGVLGLLALMDPGRRAGTTDVMALEHGATVLAVELARLRGLADTELRVRRELVHDLLTGTGDESAYLRAEALGYDLGQPHQVAVVEVADSSPAQEEVLHATRRVLRQQQRPGLLGSMAGTVVIVTAAAAGRGGRAAARRRPRLGGPAGRHHGRAGRQPLPDRCRGRLPAAVGATPLAARSAARAADAEGVRRGRADVGVRRPGRAADAGRGG